MSFGHVVIVGAGHAGGCAAAALRAANFGGRVTLLGQEAYPPYERPPLSKEVLIGSLPFENTYLRPEEWYRSSRIDLRLGVEVVEIDRASQRITTSSGERLPYDCLLLTTGARARTIAPFDVVDSRVVYLRSLKQALALRDRLGSGTRLCVIGAGFIGLEIAASARKCGCNVTVLELGQQPLGRVVSSDVGAYVADLHRRHGVDLQLKSTVLWLDAAKSSCVIGTADGRTIECDVIVVGVGAVPNTYLAEQAKIHVDDGIVVNEFGKTEDPNIYAAGDVTKHFNPVLKRMIRLEAWQNAQNQAVAIANVIAGGTQPFAEVPWLWTDQFDMNMQIAGVPSTTDNRVLRGDPVSGSFSVFQMLRGSVVGAISVNAGRDMRFARMLIASGQSVAPERLADPACKIQTLVQ